MLKENQPVPGAVPNPRNCSNCAFSVEAREPPPSIRKMRVCMWGPPQIVPSFTPQGVTLNVMHPPVNESMLCNQHRLKSEVANANASPTEGQPN